MKKLCFIISLLFASNSYALKMYICSDENSAYSCSGCKNFNQYVSFKVNVENQVVIKTYKDEVRENVNNLEGCVVADKNNWVCKSNWSNGNPSSKDTMTDGKYSSIVYNFYAPVARFFNCAK